MDIFLFAGYICYNRIIFYGHCNDVGSDAAAAAEVLRLYYEIFIRYVDG